MQSGSRSISLVRRELVVLLGRRAREHGSQPGAAVQHSVVTCWSGYAPHVTFIAQYWIKSLPETSTGLLCERAPDLTAIRVIIITAHGVALVTSISASGLPGRQAIGHTPSNGKPRRATRAIACARSTCSRSAAFIGATWRVVPVGEFLADSPQPTSWGLPCNQAQ